MFFIFNFLNFLESLILWKETNVLQYLEYGCCYHRLNQNIRYWNIINSSAWEALYAIRVTWKRKFVNENVIWNGRKTTTQDKNRYLDRNRAIHPQWLMPPEPHLKYEAGNFFIDCNTRKDISILITEQVEEFNRKFHWPASTELHTSSIHRIFWWGENIWGGLDELLNENFNAYFIWLDTLAKSCHSKKSEKYISIVLLERNILSLIRKTSVQYREKDVY